MMLSIDINTWQRKVEHISILLRDLEEKLSKATLQSDIDSINNSIIELNEWFEWLKTSIDEYYASRNKTIDEYHLELWSRSKWMWV